MTKKTITIYRPEVKYDLDFYTLKTGRRLIDKDHPQEQAEIQTSEEDEYFMERAYRSAVKNISMATKYYAGCEFWGKREITVGGGNTMEADIQTNKAGDRIPELTDRFIISFYEPYDTKPDFEENLTTALHDYLVSFALAKWFAVNAPSEAGTCLDMAAVALDSITSLFTSVAPTKRWHHA